MKQKFLVFASTFALLLTFALSTPIAQAATLQHSSVHPHSSGGGCSGYVLGGGPSDFIEVDSCISADFFLGKDLVRPDAYATYGAVSASLWSSCTITIDTIVSGFGNSVDSDTQSCLSQARSNGTSSHYLVNSVCQLAFGEESNSVCVSSGQTYYTYTCIDGYYAGKLVYTCASSPKEHI